MIKSIVIDMLLRACLSVRIVFRVLPSRAIISAASFIGSVAGRLCVRDSRVSIAQLNYALPNFDSRKEAGITSDIDGNDIKAINRRVFRHFGACVGEWLLWERFMTSQVLPGQSAHDGRKFHESIHPSGEEIIDRLAASGQGALGLSAHLGSFELLAAYLAHRGLPCSVLGRAPNYPLLEQIIRRMREDYGVEVIWSNQANAAREIVSAVRNGRVLCALIDQDTKWNSEYSSFFGLEAACPSAPIQVALRYHLPIFTSFIIRTAPMQHRVLTELIEYDKGDPEVRSKILSTYNQRLERLISTNPEQYIWWHRRWRRRPEVDYSRSPELLRNTAQYIDWLGKQHSPTCAALETRRVSGDR